MPLRISSSRKKRNSPLIMGIVFIALGIFLTIQLKSAKLLLISLIGVFALILWFKRRRKLEPVTVFQRIVDAVTSIKRINIFLIIMFIFLFSISMVSALTITLNSPTDGIEYESNSVNLNVNFNELVKCNYTLNAPLPPDSSGSSHGIFKLIPSYGDNPENYQASPVIGYTDNYNYNLNLKKGYDYTFILRCVNQENIQVSKEISFSIKDECTENWECIDWSDCNNFGQLSRTCTDTNNCDDRIRRVAKPTESQTCTLETCTENWECGFWSDCINNQKIRSCADQNSCGTIVNKPSIQDGCTVQDDRGNVEDGKATCSDADKLDYFLEGKTIIEKNGGTLTVADQCLKDLKSLADQYSLYQNILNAIISEGVIDSNEAENENILIESYCPSGIDYILNPPLYQKSYICPEGCSEGACLRESEENGGDKAKIKVKLNTGRDVEIKIMPSTASQIAIDRLGELEFEIELKEIGKGDKKRIVYEAKAKKQGRFLGLFKIKGEVITQIDANTGEIISTKKPWWSFLVSGI